MRYLWMCLQIQAASCDTSRQPSLFTEKRALTNLINFSENIFLQIQKKVFCQV